MQKERKKQNKLTEWISFEEHDNFEEESNMKWICCAHVIDKGIEHCRARKIKKALNSENRNRDGFEEE